MCDGSTCIVYDYAVGVGVGSLRVTVRVPPLRMVRCYGILSTCVRGLDVSGELLVISEVHS